MNFNPKSARAKACDYLTETTGALSYETGSWSPYVVTAEVGGPINKGMGYYIYGEFEDSQSFYDNTETKQNITQASFDFDFDINDKLVMKFGGMYHDFDGSQVTGWNPLTQDPIDNGTYITGTATPLDTNGYGKISHQKYGASSGALFNFFPSWVYRRVQPYSGNGTGQYWHHASARSRCSTFNEAPNRTHEGQAGKRQPTAKITNAIALRRPKTTV